MTPEQKIKHLVILRAIEMDAITEPAEPITATNVDALFYEYNKDWALQDARNEVRCGEEETGLSCEWSRHYESKAVAAKMPDGSWVGWTFWFGGGKHGEPEGIDWIEDAYDLNCVEEEKVVTVRTFSQPAVAA